MTINAIMGHEFVHVVLEALLGKVAHQRVICCPEKCKSLLSCTSNMLKLTTDAFQHQGMHRHATRVLSAGASAH